LSENVTTSLGMRVDQNDMTGTRVSPRTALIWRSSPQLTLKALYGRAQRAPNTYERDYDDAVSLLGNPQLARESIDTTELVAEGQPNANLGLRASLYHWQMDDLITLGVEPARGVPQYRSGGAVDANGVELSANTVWNSGARLRGSASWQDVEYAGGGALANSPQWLGRMNYSRPLVAGIHMGLELQYDGKRQAIDGTTLDDYWLVNLNLLAEGWARGLELSLTLLNLFDTSYAHPAADSNWQNSLEQDGRAARLRLDYRF
jgi:iron complex outermembrane receptor protein